MAAEEPDYTLVLRDGRFEVREYPLLVVAETVVTGPRERAANAAFDRLAGYIFGGNAPRERIAMTAPVTQRATRGERIAMTAPVTQSPAGEDRWVVQFIMPAGRTLADLPAPLADTVQLREEPSRRMAVIRFSGAPSERDLDARRTQLMAQIAERGLFADEATLTYAFYDPPWTLPFMRRNEVMVSLRQ